MPRCCSAIFGTTSSLLFFLHRKMRKFVFPFKRFIYFCSSLLFMSIYALLLFCHIFLLAFCSPHIVCAVVFIWLYFSSHHNSHPRLAKIFCISVYCSLLPRACATTCSTPGIFYYRLEFYFYVLVVYEIPCLSQFAGFDVSEKIHTKNAFIINSRVNFKVKSCHAERGIVFTYCYGKPRQVGLIFSALWCKVIISLM